jgi:hypothetical protein
MKMISSVCDEKEWTAYVGVVMKSKICGIELVAIMVVRNDIGDESSRSPTLPEAVDEQHVECGIVLTQSSQETQHAEESTFITINEIVLNVKPICGSVGVGDGVTDTGFILAVDPQPIDTGFIIDIDPSSVNPKFMPEYVTTFGDERAVDSRDDQPVPEVNNMDNALLQQALAEHAPEMPDCWDLS